MIKYWAEKLNKHRNKGSAMVTVVVIVAFISIMGTILLYVSGLNYQMKVTDYKTKESFYGAEEVAELMRTQMIIDANKAAEDAFNDVICDYEYYHGLSNKLEGLTVGTAAYKDTRKELSTYQTRYSNAFRSNFENEWKKRFASSYSLSSEPEQYYADVVPHIVPGAVYKNYDAAKNELCFTYNGYEVTIPLDWFSADCYDKTKDQINEITLVAVDGMDYTAIITTKFSIVPPTIDYNFKDTGVFFKDDVINNVIYSDWKKG